MFTLYSVKFCVCECFVSSNRKRLLTCMISFVHSTHRNRSSNILHTLLSAKILLKYYCLDLYVSRYTIPSNANRHKNNGIWDSRFTRAHTHTHTFAHIFRRTWTLLLVNAHDARREIVINVLNWCSQIAYNVSEMWEK